jgi:hypothetical protein
MLSEVCRWPGFGVKRATIHISNLPLRVLNLTLIVRTSVLPFILRPINPPPEGFVNVPAPPDAREAAAAVQDDEPLEDREFREQCRRQMQRPIESRMLYGFCRVYRPVLDDATVRIFSSTREYRDWCASNLPEYLGYQPAPTEP